MFVLELMGGFVQGFVCVYELKLVLGDSLLVVGCLGWVCPAKDSIYE